MSAEPAGREDVYCLTVPVTGALVLANGLVASNCWDETRYSLVTHHHPLPDDPERNKPKPGTFQHLIQGEVEDARRSNLRRRSMQ